MKQTMKVFLIAMLPILLGSFTPPKDFTGVIVYNITYDMENMDPQMSAYLPKTMKLTIKNPMTRSEVVMSMGSTVSIFNSDTKSGVNLMDMMGQKIAVKLSSEEMEKEFADAGEMEVINTDETKEIMGYTCKKAIVKVKNSGDEFSVYYTDELSTGIENSSNPIFKDIDGMMLEFSMNQNGMGMHFTAVNVDQKKISDNVFDIPEGFQEMTKEEMEAKFGM